MGNWHALLIYVLYWASGLPLASVISELKLRFLSCFGWATDFAYIL